MKVSHLLTKRRSKRTMNRLVVLFCLFALVAGKCKTRRPGSGSDSSSVSLGFWGTRVSHSSGDGYWRPRGNTNSVEISAAEIARNLIEADRKMDQFCEDHSDRSLREVYGVEHFQLRVKLTEFSSDDIQVRVRQRLVSIHAQDCSAQYAAVRILPDVVDPERAMWKFSEDELTVMFPYNIDPDTQVESRCGREVSEDVIIVHKSSDDHAIPNDYELSLGNEKLQKAIKRYIKELTEESNTKKTFRD